MAGRPVRSRFPEPITADTCRGRTVLTSAPGAVIAALVLLSAALIVLPERVRVPQPHTADGGPQRTGFSRRRRGMMAGTAVGAAILLLFPDRWWLAPLPAVLAGGAVGRRPVGRSVRERKADRQAVAMHADLFAACLDAGMAVATALRAVSAVMAAAGFVNEPMGRDSDVLPGTLRPAPGFGAAQDTVRHGNAHPGGHCQPLAVLDSVAAMLSLGADPQTAWRAADAVEDLAPLAAAARGSAAGGGRLAQAVREHASLLRADEAAADLRSAGRAGVLMTAPLGICFLPAFLCLGLAPVIVGLLGQLDIF